MKHLPSDQQERENAFGHCCVRLRKSMDLESSVPGERDCHWELSYDFRDVPAGDPVNLVVEYQSAGRFLHHSEDTTTVPLNIRSDTAELTAWILMPEGKEYANFRVIRRHKGKREKAEPVKIVTEYLAQDSRIIAFKLLTLSAGYDYEVSWTYR